MKQLNKLIFKTVRDEDVTYCVFDTEKTFEERPEYDYVSYRFAISLPRENPQEDVYDEVKIYYEGNETGALSALEDDKFTTPSLYEYLTLGAILKENNFIFNKKKKTLREREEKDRKQIRLFSRNR